MDFVFDDGDAAVVRFVQSQLVGGPKRDIINIAPECSHQIGSPLYHARPAGDFVEDFVDDVIGDDVEEVLAINEIAQRTSNQIKVRRSILVDSVFGHSTLSKRFTGLLRLSERVHVRFRSLAGELRVTRAQPGAWPFPHHPRGRASILQGFRIPALNTAPSFFAPPFSQAA